jgi:Na+/H+-dicarboxylate symporter
MAIWSLVTSLLGFICGIGFIVGLILGIVALNQIKQTGQGGRGFAIAGIVIGGIAIAIGIIAGIAVLAGAGSQTSSSAPLLWGALNSAGVANFSAL